MYVILHHADDAGSALNLQKANKDQGFEVLLWDSAQPKPAGDSLVLALLSAASAPDLPFNSALLSAMVEEIKPILLRTNREVSLPSYASALEILDLDDGELTKTLVDLSTGREGRRADVASMLHLSTAELAAQYRLALGKHYEVFDVLHERGIARPIQSAIRLKVKEGVGDDIQTASGDLVDVLQGAISDGSDLVICGHPGSGKSTSLDWLLHYVANDPLGRDSLLPVPASGRQFRRHPHSELFDFLLFCIESVDPKTAAGIRERKSFDGFEVVLVFDGMDELSAQDVDRATALVGTFQTGVLDPGSIVLASMRVDSFERFGEDFFSNWRRYTLQPLEPDEVAAYVTDWFRDNETMSKKMLRELKDPRLAELATRPFLLAMMSNVFGSDMTLGENRFDLYSRASQYLESRRAGLRPEATVRRTRRLLKELGLSALQLGEVELQAPLAAGIVADPRAQDLVKELSNAIHDLDEVSRETGAIQRFSGGYAFFHRSFLEYYAAEKLRDLPGGETVLLENAGIDRWEEPIRLYVGAVASADAQLQLLSRLWERDSGLTLRALSETRLSPAEALSGLLQQQDIDVRVRMLLELHARLSSMGQGQQRERLAIETARPLLEVETDSRVIYLCTRLLAVFDPDDRSRTMRDLFHEPGRRLRSILEADDVFRFSFTKIEGGEFTMGDNHSVDDIEKPEHSVSVEAFEIQPFQLTNLAFEFITNQSKSRRPPSAEEDDQPASNLTWYDAYVVGLRTACRLPRECEWEYAARAGSTSDYCFGDEVGELPRFANFEDSREVIAPWVVGTGEPNAWGLYDVHGNVWEWCDDFLLPYPIGDQQLPDGLDPDLPRVRRGGGYVYHARGCRSAFRWGNDASYRFRDIGMRLCKNSPIDE